MKIEIRLSLTPSSGPDDYDSRALEYGDTVTSPTRAPQQEQPSADQEKQEEETQLHRHHPYVQESHGGWGDEDRNDGGDGGGGVEAPQSWDDTEGVHYEGPSYARPGWDGIDGTREDWGEAGGVQQWRRCFFHRLSGRISIEAELQEAIGRGKWSTTSSKMLSTRMKREKSSKISSWKPGRSWKE
ncbi:hypothetical protein CRUP_007256 [Coryphaenoides rupestris]|nr:hypothetical protein CRUP_007256 [Coryphaenoides rupestris]